MESPEVLGAGKKAGFAPNLPRQHCPMQKLETPDPWWLAAQRGDFVTAWQISDAALRARAGVSCAHLPRHLQSVWYGAPLVGQRVLIRCYHGLGDTIQFIRYVPLVAELAAEVIVWAQPALLELLGDVSGIDRLLPLHHGQPEAEYDVDVEIMELPHVFRSTLESLPVAVPYLHSAPASWSDRHPADGLAVGLIWQAGNWDQRRSVPLPLLASLGAIPGVTLHALQRGEALTEWQPGFGPVSGSDQADEAASVMQALDVVISVDSFPAHLAGALGRPIWTLLHAAADWRWLEDRDDSPWYPTMRLFRQQQPGAWAPVVERIAGELRKLAQVTTSHMGAASAGAVALPGA